MGEDLRRTPLWNCHKKEGAKTVGFGGWEMPVQFPTGQLKEHEAVRTTAGLFDVCHMGRFLVGGEGGPAYVDSLITNSMKRIAPGRLLYSPLCREDGGVIDDITVYLFDHGCLLVVNATNRSFVWSWLHEKKPDDVVIEDRSDALAQIALQGPKAQEMFAPLVAEDLEGIGYYHYARCTVCGVPDVLVSRNGYTGEDGFEIYLPAEEAEGLWTALVEQGVSPVGLAARDTLRMEMCFCLYGNELDTDTTPFEAGLGWTVRLKKPAFVGREALVRQKQNGLRKALVGFEVTGRRMPRNGQAILHGDGPVGVVTSGGPCPSLGNKGMGLGYVTPDLTAIGTPLAIDVRGAMVEAVVVERPFYRDGTHR